VTNPTIEHYGKRTQIEQVAERVERLLVRYEELQRTNALLAQQVEVLTTSAIRSSPAWPPPAPGRCAAGTPALTS
jgi:hypothetical protein